MPLNRRIIPQARSEIMAGLPKAAEIVENLSKTQAGASEPEQPKVAEVDTSQPTAEVLRS